MELGGVGGIVLGSWVDCLPCLLLQLLPATVSPRGFKRSTRPSIGFKHSTNIYIAGAEIYGGRHRMAAISRLYPALVTKETLLSPSELELFRNLSSQLAALDFIACAAADAFAMTDLGSQFSSLVQGYHMYYGGGEGPSHNKTKHAPASEHTCEERHNRVEGI